jgi:hypothetical protein
MNAPRSGPARMMTRLPVGFGSTLATLLESSMEPLVVPKHFVMAVILLSKDDHARSGCVRRKLREGVQSLSRLKRLPILGCGVPLYTDGDQLGEASLCERHRIPRPSISSVEPAGQ